MKTELRLRIETDTDPESPRTWDNLGTMACWHRRYTLGDEQPEKNGEEWLDSLALEASPDYARLVDRIDALPWGKCDDSRVEAVRERAREAALENVILLPLYLYDHSGISISTGAFSCPWDSGQVGWIYCTLKSARENWGLPGATWDTIIPWKNGECATLKEATTEVLESEVKTYDQFLTGEVYGYIVEESEDREDWDTVESCWGYYGEKDCREEGESMLKHCRERFQKAAEKEAREREDAACRDIATV